MRKYLITAASLVSLTVASSSFAADCPADAIVVRGSSASQPIVVAVAAVAAAQTPALHVVYSKSGSSGGGVYEMVTDPATANRNNAKSAVQADGTTCDLNLPSGKPADIGVSDVYATDFNNVTVMDGATTIGTLGTVDTTLFTDTLGPVQVFTLSVHADTSFPVAISKQAAFNVFGLTARQKNDATFDVTPWTDPTKIFGRGADSGTWQTWSRNLGLLPERPVLGAVKGGAGDVLTALDQTAEAAAIGIIALNDIGNATLPNPAVRPLAYQADGQKAAFYPSSTATSTDLINVRDGHYAVWGHLHFLARKVGGAVPASVQTVLNLLDGQEAVKAVTKIKAVPNCAMQVDRASDGGDFTAYKPAKACGCFFEATATGTAPTTCTTCTDDTTCGASGQCVFGYCEAK